MAKIKLYDCFEKWHSKGTIWVFSDPHFGDPDCKIINENWVDPDIQVRIINDCVGKNDTLIILGDIGDIEYVRKLKGYKVLLTGNHDKGVSNYLRKYSLRCEVDGMSPLETEFDNRFDLYQTLNRWKGTYSVRKVSIEDNGLFDEVYSGPLFINGRILLSHEPVELGFGINIHGHVHNGKRVYFDNDGDYSMFNVAADVVAYKPVRLDKMVQAAKYKDLHRITVDLANEKKTERKDHEQ